MKVVLKSMRDKMLRKKCCFFAGRQEIEDLESCEMQLMSIAEG